ncbi:hypothetical protein BV22DRAFT_1048325 [Leucogyrophana mollusca]|uniref:Uncharacterized protein n=1 Tax=Leucogyrophana mollusca TaxID=85980 RepID=A0ACB8BBX0_9AGAM|nr:hypothetical protein BV22DRAFT_1048325 [Leucogyrophana mollusca]
MLKNTFKLSSTHREPSIKFPLTTHSRARLGNIIEIAHIPAPQPVVHIPTPARPCDFSDSSDEESPPQPTPNHLYTMPQHTCIEQSASNKPPRLMAGDLTPGVTCDWENACETYFLHKEIPNDKQVKMVAHGMLDPCINNWYCTECIMLDVGSFTKYMVAFRMMWLNTHWALRRVAV